MEDTKRQYMKFAVVLIFIIIIVIVITKVVSGLGVTVKYPGKSLVDSAISGINNIIGG